MPVDRQRQDRFVDLVAAHQGAIRKVAAVYARDPGDREDLVQEIALQLWRSFDRFRGDAAFSTFLYRVALNTALMRVRRSRRRPEVAAGDLVEDVAARTQTRDEEDVERLYGAIRRLGEIDRAIVLLVLEERSHDEIAAVTGLSVGAVGVRMVRCKDKLRRLLGVGGGTREDAACSTRT